LLAGATRVVAVEGDARAIAALAELVEAAEGRLVVVEADAQTIDPVPLGPAPRRIVANLPYNVGTPLLIAWLRRMGNFESLILMFQKEVAERLVAGPGQSAYGRLSVLVRATAEARRLFDVAPSAFTPPPKVVSSVVRLTPHPDPVGDLDAIEEVTAAAFGQRRKMLRQSLKSLGVPVEPLLTAAQVDPTVRAETLDVAEFARLAHELKHLRASG
jgi:16S rRNA (adenine1518-N6/adenine1519-N6)-dimethyltransferase